MLTYQRVIYSRSIISAPNMFWTYFEELKGHCHLYLFNDTEFFLANFKNKFAFVFKFQRWPDVVSSMARALGL